MCGFAGIISPSQREKISNMTSAIMHRGPDGEGFYHDDYISIGHRRLSIIDLEGGKQPISNETGQLQLVCNGEIYNSPQLRLKPYPTWKSYFICMKNMEPTASNICEGCLPSPYGIPTTGNCF